jgi:hypothetical protein
MMYSEEAAIEGIRLVLPHLDESRAREVAKMIDSEWAARPGGRVGP